jgi:nucleotide-binding universal stress UspA family protein
VSGKRRRSFESGHRPKFMVVVDETPECARAVHFAARRASRTGASLLMIAAVDPPDNFEWIGVGEAMIAEAQEDEQLIVVDDKTAAIAKVIDEDEDISFLVLAAGTGKDGPGPLVSAIAGKAAASFPIPIVIVPGGLSDEEIDALAG